MNIRGEFPEDESVPPPDDELSAGEYVLGVLDAEERRRAQARIEAEPGFALQVAAWERHFGGWLRRIDPVDAPAHVWPRVRTQLGWSPVDDARRGVWQNVSFWRAATALAAAAAVIAVFVGRTPQPPPTPQPQPVVIQPVPPPESQLARPVTVLANDEGTTGWLASIDASSGKVLMVPVPSAADPGGRVHELWIIPEGEAPQSLGFVSNEKAHTVTVPDALRRALAKGSTLAITLEPEAGIPHAAPTGPVVAKGGIQAI
jgi:anti-sigma-K factor RskA